MSSSVFFCRVVALWVCWAVGANAQPVADEVHALPGWTGALPSKWYSGFLDVGSSKRLHYVFIEAESPLRPSDAPLVLWLNGGPGCSSLEGLLYEHGPLVVADAHAPPNINFDGAGSTNTDANALVRNKWSWSKAANMLYLEAPAGVGFSYSSNPADYNTGDNQTAADNLAALHAFFSKFPMYTVNDFYVSGESYGGVYVPTLSQKIYEDDTFPGRMKGYLVGNGVFDWDTAAATQVPFAYGHGFVSTKMYNKILATCKDKTYLHPSKACKELLDEINSLEVDMNGYDAYRTCFQPKDSPRQSRAHPTMTMRHAVDLLGRASVDKSAGLEWLHLLRQSVVPCINSVEGTKYLRSHAVREALHVDVSPNTWQICGGVNYTDDGVYPSMIAVHKAMQKYSPRVLIYNGDVDPGCNYLWAEASVEKFGLAIHEDWRPWVYEDSRVGEQLGGFVTAYQQNVTFTTIHGAGHMSPQWRPEAVYNMLIRFLDGKRF